MKILIDMNLTRLWCDFLTEADIETIHWSSIGRADASDETIMHYAQQHGMVILTEDLDFGILLARNRLTGPSVVQLRIGMNLPRQIGAVVVQALQAAEQQLEQGAFLSIGSGRTRSSLLPLR